MHYFTYDSIIVSNGSAEELYEPLNDREVNSDEAEMGKNMGTSTPVSFPLNFNSVGEPEELAPSL